MKLITTSFIALILSSIVHVQAQLNFDSLITVSTATFNGNGKFSGRSWQQLVERTSKSNYILIGEDHFISEVPLFTTALVNSISCDNYICEIDQWMLNIFKDKISSLSAPQLDKWINENSNGFSFFQKKNEFDLMRSFIDKQVNLIGIEQVGLMSTTIIFQYLFETGSPKNKALYKVMRDSSTAANNRFFSDYSKKYFFATPFFRETIKQVNRSGIKDDESKLLDAITRSADIYATGSHRNRIKLMQNNLMDNYPEVFKGKKNVFKFGANHTIRGESYIPIYDIGTTAHIMAQAENQDSFHILILPKTGFQAGFLKGKNPIDLNEDIYASLKPLFEKSSDTEWTSIDLEAIRNAVRRQKYVINNPTLEKTIKGYDVLIVIPTASAAEEIR